MHYEPQCCQKLISECLHEHIQVHVKTELVKALKLAFAKKMQSCLTDPTSCTLEHNLETEASKHDALPCRQAGRMT